MTITRYSRDYNDMCEWPSGKWVKYSDHAAQLAALKEENERLRREIVDLRKGNDRLEGIAISEQRKSSDLRARVAELEGAARYLRTCQNAYMLERGNDELGKAVGDAAAKLDELLREPANEG